MVSPLDPPSFGMCPPAVAGVRVRARIVTASRDRFMSSLTVFDKQKFPPRLLSIVLILIGGPQHHFSG
jgi:hypothetical protein